MTTRTLFPCRVITPDDVAFEGDVQMMIVSGRGGQIGFLANHAPLVADLKMGFVRVQLEDGSWSEWATQEGFVSVHDNTGLAVVEDALDVQQIDTGAAQRIIDAARPELERGPGESDEVYHADKVKAEREIAWGEHLLAMAGQGSAAAH